METEMQKADKIFAEINQKLMPENKGKIVAIDVNSGNYAVGDELDEAYEKIIKKHPKEVVFKRIGYGYVYFVGAM